MKNKITKLSIASLFLFNSAVSLAAENEAFSKVENKFDEILEFMTGSIVTTFLAICIVVAGIFLARGRGNPTLMWGILLGAILIGSASQIASWLLT